MNKYFEAEKKIKSYIDSLYIKDNSVIVYDIDETLIDTNGNLIQPIVNTYNYALTKGLKISLITARPGFEENIEWTRDQLKQLGLNNYINIYFRVPERHDVWRYKTMARKNLWDQNYVVEMSIGDMAWDMGEFGGLGILI